NANDRAAAFSGVNIVLVGLRLAALGVIRLLEPDDAAAQSSAAVGDFDPRLAALGEPRADRVGESGIAQAEYGKRNGSGAQDGHGKPPHLIRLWSEPILPTLRQADNRRGDRGLRDSSALHRLSHPTPRPPRGQTPARAPDWRRRHSRACR